MLDEKNGGSKSEGSEAEVTVVDRRHHALQEGNPEPAEGRSPYPTYIEELQARADLAERAAREAIAKAQDEFDAVRKRLERDVDRRVDERRAPLLGSIVEVADNLERAREVAAAESTAIADGIELIRQQVLGILKAEGVEPIETLGQEYDPNVAEAVGLVPVEQERDNFVVEEIQRGYRLGERILRPARVKVGKAG